MEDAHAAVLDLQQEKDGKQPQPAPPDKRLAFFGVYDGHGGEKVAQFTGENLHKIVAKQEGFAKADYEQALKDGFLATDRAILNGMPLQAQRSNAGPVTDSNCRYQIRG
jgi:protein phosphatase PTC2/3